MGIWGTFPQAGERGPGLSFSHESKFLTTPFPQGHRIHAVPRCWNSFEEPRLGGGREFGLTQVWCLGTMEGEGILRRRAAEPWL